MAVLVVGGAGYIGSHAAHVLRRKGYDVIIYDDLSNGRKELADGFELIVGDIAESTKLAKVLARCDAVMDFAAHAYVGESVQNPRNIFTTTSSPRPRSARRGDGVPRAQIYFFFDLCGLRGPRQGADHGKQSTAASESLRLNQAGV